MSAGWALSGQRCWLAPQVLASVASYTDTHRMSNFDVKMGSVGTAGCFRCRGKVLNSPGNAKEAPKEE